VYDEAAAVRRKRVRVVFNLRQDDCHLIGIFLSAVQSDADVTHNAPVGVTGQMINRTPTVRYRSVLYRQPVSETGRAAPITVHLTDDDIELTLLSKVYMFMQLLVVTQET
jgi:hypothetical protein